MPMPDLSQLAKNKPALIGAAAVGVVGLGLYSRKKSGEAPPAGDAGTQYSAGGQAAGAAGAYDSTASDIYGALSPQLTSIGSQLSELLNGKATPVPVPKPPTTTTPRPNPLPKPSPSPKPAVPSRKTVSTMPVKSSRFAVDTFYTVKPGDNLSKIAARYPQGGITANTIYAANKGTVGANPNLIKPGQRLHVFGN